MPSYCFRIGDDASDSAGDCAEHDDIAAAKCAAIKLAGNIVCDEAAAFWDGTEWTMTVSTPAGLTLFQILIVGIDAPALGTVRTAPATYMASSP